MIPRRKLHNRVVVEAFRGSGSLGAVYDEPKEYPALVESLEQVVLDSQGREVVSSTTVYLNPADIPTRSKVTVWPGEDIAYETTVLSTRHYRKMRLEHTVLRLQ